MKSVSFSFFFRYVVCRFIEPFFFFTVEFATIRLVQNEIKYDQFKPEQIDALLKEQNVGANTTEATQ